MKWFSPAEVQVNYSVKRSTSYQLIKEYEESGGEVIKIGRIRRVSEEQFTEFLLKRSK